MQRDQDKSFIRHLTTHRIGYPRKLPVKSTLLDLFHLLVGDDQLTGKAGELYFSGVKHKGQPFIIALTPFADIGKDKAPMRPKELKCVAESFQIPLHFL